MASSATSLHGPATWSAIAHLPEGTRVEILDGEVLFAPSPSPSHQGIASRLTYLVGGPFGVDNRPGGWWILPDVDVELEPPQLVQPDLAGWRRERVPDFPHERPIRIVPDWTCEILSPSSRRNDTFRKLGIYLRTGVGWYWIVDPEERMLMAYERVEKENGPAWLLLGSWGDEGTARIAPFDAIELDLAKLFPPAPPAVAAPPDP